MARLIALVLMIVGIYLGVSIYARGANEAVPDAAAIEDGSGVQAQSEPWTPGEAAPSAITSRVRERVTSAIEDGARRHSGE